MQQKNVQRSFLNQFGSEKKSESRLYAGLSLTILQDYFECVDFDQGPKKNCNIKVLHKNTDLLFFSTQILSVCL